MRSGGQELDLFFRTKMLPSAGGECVVFHNTGIARSPTGISIGATAKGEGSGRLSLVLWAVIIMSGRLIAYADIGSL